MSVITSFRDTTLRDTTIPNARVSIHDRKEDQILDGSNAKRKGISRVAAQIFETLIALAFLFGGLAFAFTSTAVIPVTAIVCLFVSCIMTTVCVR